MTRAAPDVRTHARRRRLRGKRQDYTDVLGFYFFTKYMYGMLYLCLDLPHLHIAVKKVIFDIVEYICNCICLTKTADEVS